LESLAPEDRYSLNEALQHVRSSMEPLRETARSFGDALRAMHPGLGSLLESTSRWARFDEMLHGVSKALAIEQIHMRDRLRTLVHAGWFIDPEMPLTLVRNLAEALEDGEENSAEQVLLQYYRTSGSATLERVCRQSPGRAGIIKQAYLAHEQGKYALSVPVFLMQADGIADDVHKGRQLFSKAVRRSVGALASEHEVGSDEWVYLSVYAEDSPLVKNTKDLGPGFDGLNRHGVLHGTDLTYCTEVNSLRALSALGYAAFVLLPEVESLNDA